MHTCQRTPYTNYSKPHNVLRERLCTVELVFQSIILHVHFEPLKTIYDVTNVWIEQFGSYRLQWVNLTIWNCYNQARKLLMSSANCILWYTADHVNSTNLDLFSNSCQINQLYFSIEKQFFWFDYIFRKIQWQLSFIYNQI